MVDGYIKLYRQLLDNPFWKEKPFSRGQAWVDLLMKANFTDQKTFIKGKLVKLKRGQLLRGTESLASEWGWSVGKVRRFLDTLEQEGMITKNGTPDGTLVTIENYTFFQDGRQPHDTPDGTPDGRPDGRPDGTRYKKDKESIKKGKKGPHPPEGRLDWIDDI